MPVDFHDLPPEEPTDAKHPNLIVWSLLLVVAIAVGVALTLFLWPKGRSTHDWKFFAWMFGVPPLIWACGFAARLHSYEIRVWRTQDHNTKRAETITHNTTYARRPVALLGSACITAMGQDKLSERIIAGETALETCEVRNTKEVRAHSELPRAKFASTADLLDSVLTDLLTTLKPVLLKVPHSAPLEVWLDIQDEAAANECDSIWERVRHLLGRPANAPIRLASHDGVMALDAWLDDDSPASEKYVLLIAVQLRSEVPANTGEAAAALLFGWPDRAHRDRRPATTLVHRPVVAPSDRERTALATALDWGAAQPADVERTWISGLTELRRDANLVCLPQATTDAAPLVASIDAGLGHTGNACGWLAIAVAAEQCRAGGGIQFISTEAMQQPCWLVVRPPPSSSAT